MPRPAGLLTLALLAPLALLAALCLGAAPRLELSDRLADLRIEGGRVLLPDDAGGTAELSPGEFVALVRDRQGTRRDRGWLYRLFDITGPLGLTWVALGLLGQALFTGRMVVQWLTSERAGRSVVPPAFWWMSLAGATMLLAYFTWRVDVVGILGQATGWFIYARNLFLLRRPPP